MAKITNTSNITFKYQLPDQSEVEDSVTSNVATVENMTTSLQKQLSSSKDFGLPGDEITIELILTNTSEYDVSEVNIKDTIGTGATFKEGTVTIDGTPQASFDPVTGFQLPETLTKNGGSSTIKYTITVDDNPTVETFTVVSEIDYTVAGVEQLTENSNTVTIAIETIMVSIAKTSDKVAVISGSTVKFQNVITNKGNLTHTNVVFKDPIPAGTQFVENSVKIDNVDKPGYNPETGFALEDLTPNAEITVTFEVTVD